MAQEIREPQTLEMADDQISNRMLPESASADPSLSRNVSFSRLNACAPEFVPRAPALTTNHGGANRGKIHHHQHHQHHHHHHHQPVMHVVYHHPRPPPPPPVSPQFVVPSPASHYHPHHEYYGGGGVGEYEPDLDQSLALPPARDGLSEEVIQKIRKQVFFFSYYDSIMVTI